MEQKIKLEGRIYEILNEKTGEPYLNIKGIELKRKE